MAYIEVVGLKTLNDSMGHAAGDDLLQRVVGHLRAHLRSYDLIIRIGGDEFLCAMTDMTLLDARERFRQVAGMLADSGQVGWIRAGLAELGPDDDATQLIERADAELSASRA
ncbi:MAG TPA: GGDEF domain-containing protein [Solirubrobacteraceae bacterium]|nr:GGDEF domain-containing protein [Solirubrobacteraceae bacterium]